MVLLIIVLFICIILAVPIGFSIGTASLVQLLNTDLPLTVLAQRFLVSVDNFVLLSIPFFILAGYIMNAGGLTQRLVRLCTLLVGWIPGGLAHVNVVASMFFGGITGAAVADTAAIGPILIPAMKKDGYSPEFSAALTYVREQVALRGR